MTILDRLYDDKLWELKNRPKLIKDIILPPRIKNIFSNTESLNDVGNLLLSGPKGSGKTTLAACIADNSGRDTLYINMSLDTGIEGIRDKVMKFVTTQSFESRKKIVIGDEFDRLSVQSMDSLKSIIERFSSNVNFIFISNHKAKLTEEIIDRLTEIDFIFSQKESLSMKKQFFKRVCLFLKAEGIPFENNAIGQVVSTTFPSMRKVWVELQKIYKIHNFIDEKTIVDSIISDIKDLMTHIKKSDYPSIKKYIANQSIDLTTFYSLMYNNIENFIEKDSIGEAIILLAKYQFESFQSVDKSIPLSAMCIELSRLKMK